MKKIYLKYKTKKILGALFLLIGIIIILKVVPVSFLFFLLGGLFIGIGIYILKWVWK